MGPAVTITATTWWPAPARVAMAFARLGFSVRAICPAGHPLRYTRAVTSCTRYPFIDPLPRLHAAIAADPSALIIPCDDRAVAHLHALHDADRQGVVGAAIRRSLGDPEHFATLRCRATLLHAAAGAGIRVPGTQALGSMAELDAWQAPLPWLIKTDMSWGGAGVRIVGSREEAERALQAMARPLGAARALKRLLINRDGFWLRPWLSRSSASTIVQQYIHGCPANIAIACHDGEVLVHLAVRALATQGATGASTMVEVIEHAEMLAAARTLAKRFRLSGFHGLDFMLDERGMAWLIEMNARATQLCHIALEGRPSLVDALAMQPALSAAPAPAGTVIAFFPQAWRSEPNGALRSVFHDVPWEEPALVEALMRPPWPNRGLAARAWQLLLDPRSGKDAWAGAAPVPAAETSGSSGEMRSRTGLSAVIGSRANA
jgi:ATP-grasp domain